jgi:hypothetical protein
MAHLPPIVLRRGPARLGIGDLTASASGTVTSSGAYGAAAGALDTADKYTGGLTSSYAIDQTNKATAALWSSLSSDQQNALIQGSKALGQGEKLVDLISQMHGGLTKEQAIALQTQTFATLAVLGGMVNPMLGAALAVWGALVIGFEEVMFSIFGYAGAYGLPPPQWTYTGLLRNNIDTIPYPPGADAQFAPTWLHFPTIEALNNFTYHGRPAGKDIPALPPVDARAMTDSNLALWQLYQWALVRRTPWDQNVADSIVLTMFPTSANAADAMTAFQQSEGLDSTGFHNKGPGAPLDLSAYSPDAFEQFFNMILCANLEYWANGNPFLPIRKLLAAAVEAWNKTHPHATSQYTYKSYPASIVTGVSNPTATWPSELSGPPGLIYYVNTVQAIISGYGGYLDPSTPRPAQDPDFSVNADDTTPSPAALAAAYPASAATQIMSATSAANAGAAIQAANYAAYMFAKNGVPPTRSTSLGLNPLTLTSKSTQSIAAGAGAVTVTVGASALVYSIVTGQAVESVLKMGWREFTGLFR